MNPGVFSIDSVVRPAFLSACDFDADEHMNPAAVMFFCRLDGPPKKTQTFHRLARGLSALTPCAAPISLYYSRMWPAPRGQPARRP
eukprot:753230-Pyramimonas_sp.AAC.1